jgi:hypothetical protein
VVGFGRSCRLGPVSRVVFDVLVDARFHGRGLRAEILRLLTQDSGLLEEVSIYEDRHPIPLEPAEDREKPGLGGPRWASAETYLGKRVNRLGGSHE